MERVVYIVGAGFSAPLGIPTVANFIQKARDLYTQEPNKFSRFKQTLAEIRGLGVVKTIFKANTLDLEEVLSILQTEKDYGGTGGAEAFIDLIREVVLASTPNHPSKALNDLQVANYALASDAPQWDRYVNFVAHLFRLLIAFKDQKRSVDQIHADKIGEMTFTYDVISLNYDLVLESAANYINRAFVRTGNDHSWLTFRRDKKASPVVEETGQHRPLLAKLHGCCELNNIIAPTANKTLTVLKDQWELAYEALSLANHVRLIGFSLPEGDAAVRYLLKAAMSKMDNPKSIDVLCVDPYGHVKNRYGDLFDFPSSNYRFVSGRTEEYLDALMVQGGGATGTLSFANTERMHNNFFSRSAVRPGDKF